MWIAMLTTAYQLWIQIVCAYNIEKNEINKWTHIRYEYAYKLASFAITYAALTKYANGGKG